MAYNSISTFIAGMNVDGLRPNLFEIVFGSLDAEFSVRAKATSIPSSNLGVASVFYFGRQVKFAGNRTFADWTVSVLMDEVDYGINGNRGRLERWMNELNTHVGNRRAGGAGFGSSDPSQYQRDATIIHWSKDGTIPLATYEMRNCFPINIGELPLDWQANDTIAEYSVTFALNYWTRVVNGITT